MKKLISLLLVVLTLTTLLCSCGTKIESIDPSKYITLGDYKNFNIDELKEAYVAARKENAKNYTSFNVDWGYTIQFNVVCEIVTVSDKKKEYTKYDEYCFENDKTVTLNIYEDTKNAYRADFDSALVYEITKAGEFSKETKNRKVTLGTAFDFEYAIPYMADKPEISGKTVRFTITPVSVLPPLYDDLYIVDESEAFFKANSTTTTVVRMGDIVTATITGTIDGQPFDGNRFKDLTFTVGCSPFIHTFDEQIVGFTTKTQKEVEVTYPADWTDPIVAGKTVKYAVAINNAYSFDAILAEKTPYKSLYEYKEALRFKLYVISNIMGIVYDRCTLNAVPDNLYKDYYKTIKAQTEEFLIDDYIYFMSYQGQTCTRDEAIVALFESKDGYNKYLEEATTSSVRDALICYAIANEMKLTMVGDDYLKALTEFTEAYNEDYSQKYSTKQLEKKFGENYLKLIFMENLVSNEIVKTLDGVAK